MSTIQYLLFDLDDTLYSNASKMFDVVGQRIEAWTSQTLGITLEEARALRREYFRAYGTTLVGLRRHHPEADIDDYLDYVHAIDVTRYLDPAPELDAMLTRLPAPKVIFTNGIVDWAERVTERLGVRQHFERIIDVRAIGYRSKPDAYAYQYVLSSLGVPGSACAMLDDQPGHLRAAATTGMRTVLVRPGGQAENGIEFAVNTVLEAEAILQKLLM